MFSKTVLIAIFVTVFSQLSEQKPVSGPDYSRCDEDYQCFGLPNSKCVDEKSCEVLLKTQAQEKTNDVDFELFWVRPSNSSDSWVSTALSTDTHMGNDSATIFIIDANGTVQSEEGLTFVNGNGKGVHPVHHVKGITIKKTRYTNGVLYAKWSRTQKTTVDDLSFDMKTTEFYIFLAYGAVKDGHLRSHHKHHGRSDHAVNLEDDTPKIATSPTPSPTTTKTSPSSATTSNTSVTPAGNSTTVAPTHSGSSTATSTGKSTDTEGPSKGTTARGTTSGPKSTTKKPSNASTITLSLFIAIFAAILLILN